MLVRHVSHCFVKGKAFLTCASFSVRLISNRRTACPSFRLNLISASVFNLGLATLAQPLWTGTGAVRNRKTIYRPKTLIPAADSSSTQRRWFWLPDTPTSIPNSSSPNGPTYPILLSFLPYRSSSLVSDKLTNQRSVICKLRPYHCISDETLWIYKVMLFLFSCYWVWNEWASMNQLWSLKK